MKNIQIAIFQDVSQHNQFIEREKTCFSKKLNDFSFYG
jgi:hypothetical protein